MRDLIKYSIIVAVALLTVGYMASVAYGNHEEKILNLKYYNDWYNETKYPSHLYPELGHTFIPSSPTTFNVILVYDEQYYPDIDNMTVRVIPDNIDESVEIFYTGWTDYTDNGNYSYSAITNSLKEEWKYEFDYVYRFAEDNSTHAYIQGVIYYWDTDRHYQWGVVRNHVSFDEYKELVNAWEFERPENQSSIEYNMSKNLNEEIKTLHGMIEEYDEKLDRVHMMIDELNEYSSDVMRPKYFEISELYSDLDELNDEFSEIAVIDGLDWRKTPLVRDR